LLAFLIGTLGQVAALLFEKTSSPGFSSITFSGPYSFLFACFVQFYKEVPVFYRFRLCGVLPLHDKFLTYLLGLQLLLVDFPSSCINSLFGVVSGMLYSIDGLGLKNFILPSYINSFCSRFIAPLLNSNSNPTIRRTGGRPNYPTAQQTIPAGQGYRDTLIPAAAANPFPINDWTVAAPPQPPSEANINQLVGMGFTREASMQALHHSGNNVQLAINSLLGAN